MTNTTLDLDALAAEGQEDGVAVTAPFGPGQTRDHSMYDERSLFTSREASWMKLGTVIEGDVDGAEAARLGGLDFDVELYPAGFTRNNGKNYKRVAERFAIVREDTGDFFNFASSEYGVVQYRDAFTFLDAINPRYVAAGCLRGGRVGFVVVKHPDVEGLSSLELNGNEDPHDFYVVVRTSQDMSYAVEISLMTLRGRCMNELTMSSFTRKAPQRWSLRHSKSVHERMHQAQTVLTNGGAYLTEFERIARRLSDIDVNTEKAKEVLTHVLPDRPRRDKQIEEILGVYESSAYNGFQGTGWGLVQGVSEYFQWERPGRPQTDAQQFQSVLEGQTHQRVDKTAQVLLALAS
jgi:phage/plasmid-like protein (TIGR03299 family)